MKKQTPQSSAQTSVSSSSTHNHQAEPFFKKNKEQKKEDLFFSKTRQHPFFKSNQVAPAASVQAKVVSNNLPPSKNTNVQENKTGLPDQLKSGIENLSGYSMDDVKVHYSSNKPAQLNAHAYVQGTDIHVASGQEKHLPHETWHVVQQKQGRVKPTMQMKGKVSVNDDDKLEQEADSLGADAMQLKNNAFSVKSPNNPLFARHSPPHNQQLKTIHGMTQIKVIQRVVSKKLKKGTEVEIIIGDEKGLIVQIESENPEKGGYEVINSARKFYKYEELNPKPTKVKPPTGLRRKAPTLIPTLIPTGLGRKARPLRARPAASPVTKPALPELSIHLIDQVNTKISKLESTLSPEKKKKFHILIRFYNNDNDMQSKAYQAKVSPGTRPDKQKLIELAVAHMYEGKTKDSPFVSFTEDITALMQSIEGTEVSASVRAIIQGGDPKLHGKPRMEARSRPPARRIGIFLIPKNDTINSKEVEAAIKPSPQHEDLKKHFLKEKEVVAYSPKKLPAPKVSFKNPFYDVFMKAISKKGK